MTPALRTPDERFKDLPDWPYAPKWLEPLGDGLRMHFIDEGPRDAVATVLCLHGNPSWSFLYRHMIPVFLAAGLRVVAPDLIRLQGALHHGRTTKLTSPDHQGFIQ